MAVRAFIFALYIVSLYALLFIQETSNGSKIGRITRSEGSSPRGNGKVKHGLEILARLTSRRQDLTRCERRRANLFDSIAVPTNKYLFMILLLLSNDVHVYTQVRLKRVLLVVIFAKSR
ncbi:Hypothetical predicted protein [Paramuricea clavata]|uniref:Uncharacterized protein n=1 Tax=Paramuricea clavata TaxID=317549 RepID=A0A7D9LVJ2_PARCT|nr:Hypothetical predicted protein [Paramuricea clavata]